MPRYRPLTAGGGDHAAPMSDLNITPLIDVMLVLLIMFILILPTVTHEVPLDLPTGGVRPVAAERHRLELGRDGAAVLDGARLDDAGLAARLAALSRRPDALLVLRADQKLRYGRFARALVVVKRAGVTRLAFEGNRPPAW